jgi:putative ABC transport system substrate-binding protein
LDLLLKLVPTANTIAVLSNPTNPTSEPDVKSTRAAAAMIGHTIELFNASTDAQIDNAFESIAKQRIQALVVNPDPYLTNHGKRIVEHAARYAIPAIYGFRSYSAAGGLMSYGASLAEMRRQLGQYVGRILKGAKPADLPILQPTKFELLINLKAAASLGLTVPPNLLALVDEVIE